MKRKQRGWYQWDRSALGYMCSSFPTNPRTGMAADSTTANKNNFIENYLQNANTLNGYYRKKNATLIWSICLYHVFPAWIFENIFLMVSSVLLLIPPPFCAYPLSLLLSLFASVSLVIPLSVSLSLSPPLSSVSVSPPHSVFILLSHSLRLSQGPEVRIDRGEILTDWLKPGWWVLLFHLLLLQLLLFLLFHLEHLSLPSPSSSSPLSPLSLHSVHLHLLLILPLLRYSHTAEDLS